MAHQTGSYNITPVFLSVTRSIKGVKEALWELGPLPNNATFWTGLKPGPLDLESEQHSYNHLVACKHTFQHKTNLHVNFVLIKIIIILTTQAYPGTVLTLQTVSDCNSGITITCTSSWNYLCPVKRRRRDLSYAVYMQRHCCCKIRYQGYLWCLQDYIHCHNFHFIFLGQNF